MSDELVKPGLTANEAKILGASIVKASKKDLKKAGQLLVKSASSKVEVVFLKVVEAKVQELVQHRSNLHIALERTNAEIRKFDDRIHAIEEGEYSVDWQGNILYNDTSLQY